MSTESAIVRTLIAAAACACAASQASALPLGGLGSPTDDAALSDGTVIDFSGASGSSATSISIGGVTFSGQDTRGGAAVDAPLHVDTEFDVAEAAGADLAALSGTSGLTVEQLQELFTVESDGAFNTTGASLFNGERDDIDLGVVQDPHANRITIDFASEVDAFGFNFGATDNAWTLAAYDADDVLLDRVTVPVIADANDGDWIGIAAEGISYAVLTDPLDPASEFPDGEWIYIDNFTVAFAPIPTPAALPLLAFGLATFVVARRRCA